MKGILPNSLLCGEDGLVKAAELNKRHRYSNERPVQSRIHGTHANGTFKAPDRLFRQSGNSTDPASAVPYLVRIWIERDRAVGHLDLRFTITNHERRNGSS